MSSDELVGIKSTILLDNRQSMLYSDQGNEYLIKKSCQVVNPQIYKAQSVGNSQIAFQIQVPSKSVLVDTKAFIRVKALLTFSQVVDTLGAYVLPTAPGVGLTGGQYNGVAFGAMRATPLSSVTENLSVYINGVSISNTVNDFSQLYSLGLYTQDMNRLNYSGSFSYGDKAQQYVGDSGQDAIGSSCNPFATYINSDGSATFRGDRFYNILTNPAAVSTVNPTVATMEVEWYEPVLSAPFNWNGRRSDGRALGGLNQLQFNWTLSNITRMWSGFQEPLTPLDVSISITAADMLLTMITPSPILGPLPSRLLYDCELLNNYKTEVSGAVASQAERNDVVSNNIQLNVIPSKVVIYVSKNWSKLSGSSIWATTDCLARITGINIQFNNVAGIFSQADEFQLYQISVRNGLEMSWPDWKVHRGSIFIADFGLDIGSSDVLSSVGVSGQYNFQAQVRFQNPNDVEDPDGFLNPAYEYTLNCLFLQDAVMEITPSFTRLSNGFDRSVILRDINSGNVDLNTVDFAYVPNMVGSAWWNNLNDFKQTLVKGLRTIHKHLPQIESAYDKYAAPLLPGGVNTGFRALAQVAHQLIPVLVGQGMSGGKIHKMFEGQLPREEIDRLIMQSSGKSRLKKNRY